MRIQSDGAILAAFYSGIGDAILHGPTRMALRHAFGDRLTVPETSGMELIALAPAVRGIRTVPSEFRKLHTRSPEDATALLRRSGISVVLNFRRDRVAAPMDYLRF